ncbi:hypothetical protein [Ascidiimonas aurantiaca]|uniref:hypothetical protein n=1 Tax=Ascidiimonas aurantiaca TaxID=1685432 RepID=UPI0030EC3073
MISLKSSHIYIENELVKTVFGNIHYAYAVYNTEQELLLVTPVSSQWFIKMYENPVQFLLKERNLKGDKTLAIHEILIDNDLAFFDRELEFELIEKTSLLKIKI